MSELKTPSDFVGATIERLYSANSSTRVKEIWEEAVRARDKEVRLALLEEVVDRVTKGHALKVKAPFVTAIQDLRAEIEAVP